MTREIQKLLIEAQERLTEARRRLSADENELACKWEQIKRDLAWDVAWIEKHIDEKNGK